MPQYTHLDRCMIEAEAMLWVVAHALGVREHSGMFADRINKIQQDVEQLAKEMAEYNDQFETE